MEGRDGIASGVTLLGGEAPSSAYHVASRPLGGGGGTPSAGIPEKKKRGRPRKYAPDGTLNPTSSPRPMSASASRSAGEYSSVKHKKKVESGYFPGEENTSGLGTCFMPHIVKIKSGEDVTMRILALSQQGPRAVCILAASGSISTVTLVQDGSSGGTLTYEGRFEILQLSGSFTPTDVQGTRNRTGSMSITVVGPNGQVLGGVVAGILIAASPIQLVVGSFLPINYQQQQQQQQKPKKQKAYHSGHESMGMPEMPNAEKDDGGPSHNHRHGHGHGHQNSGHSRPDLGTPSHFQRENWPSMSAMHEPRNMGTDINMEANLNGGGSRGGLNLYPDHNDH